MYEQNPPPKQVQALIQQVKTFEGSLVAADAGIMSRIETKTTNIVWALSQAFKLNLLQNHIFCHFLGTIFTGIIQKNVTTVYHYYCCMYIDKW